MRNAFTGFIACLGCSLTLAACESAENPEPRDAGPPLSNHLKTLNQVGVVVEDVDAVSERWQQVLGIGPWIMEEHSGKNAQGKPFEARFAHASVGELELELVQITNGETPHTDVLDDSGEGLFHLGFFVDDVDRRAAQLVEDGAEIVLQEPGEWAYVDSPKTGTLLKLIERREPFSIPASDAGRSPDAFVVDAIDHVGVVVKDLEAATTHWDSEFGADGWSNFPGFTLTAVDGSYVEADIAFHPLGAVQVELVQVKTDTLPAELTDYGADGEGIYEMAFAVTDLKATLTKLTDDGARILLDADTVAFVDVGGGAPFELLEQ